jgi:hypothetical protein
MSAGRRRRIRRPSGAIEIVGIRILADGRMDRANAAKYLGRRPQTLAVWAMHGKGPRPHNVGGRTFYFLDDLDAYVAAAGPMGALATQRRHGERCDAMK